MYKLIYLDILHILFTYLFTILSYNFV